MSDEVIKLMEMFNTSIDHLRNSVETKIDTVSEKMDDIADKVNTIERNTSVHISEHEIKIAQLEKNQADINAKIATVHEYSKIAKILQTLIFNRYFVIAVIALGLLFRGTLGARVQTAVDKYLGYKPTVELIDSTKNKNAILIDTTKFTLQKKP